MVALLLLLLLLLLLRLVLLLLPMLMVMVKVLHQVQLLELLVHWLLVVEILSIRMNL